MSRRWGIFKRCGNIRLTWSQPHTGSTTLYLSFGVSRSAYTSTWFLCVGRYKLYVTKIIKNVPVKLQIIKSGK